MRAYKASGIPFVVIFDEYDVTSCIALAYITGILPIIREKAQSKLNNFREITFLEPFRYAPFTGFTSDEVRFLCGKYGMDFEECKSWYDGYAVEGIDIYAPNSMVSAMQNGRFRGYWGQTSTYRVVKDLIGLDMVGMKDDVFTYLCHLGYLAYDIETGTCRIPSNEVRAEWVNSIDENADYASLMGMISGSEELLRSAWAMDCKALSEVLEKSHERLTSSLPYNNEQSLQSANDWRSFMPMHSIL